MNSIREQIFGGERSERRSLLGAKRKKGADAGAGLTSVAIPRAESRLSDSRDGDRHRLTGEQVVVKHGRTKYHVDLVNLSGGGAMVAGDFKPKLWDHVSLQLGEGAALEAIVRWVKGGRVGLEFAHETQIDCAPVERAKLLQQVIARSFGTEVAVSTPEARETKPAPAPETKGEEGRGEFRHPLIWSGHIHYDFDSTPVRVRNISKNGALIECVTPLPVGAEPLLDLGEAGSVFARVSWAVGDQVGLAFQTEFDLSDLVKSRPDLAPVDWQAPSYLDNGPKASQAQWSDPWQRLSVRELSEELEGFLKR